jgi:hypothetical protein
MIAHDAALGLSQFNSCDGFFLAKFFFIDVVEIA